MSDDLRTRQTIDRLLAAIESRDLRAVQAALHPNATWQNVPHPSAEGRPAVMALLANILCWSDQVCWDVISSSVDGQVGWYERVDRFWLLAEEYAVHCSGVFTVDPATNTVCEVKDYVDLGEWRDRVMPVLQKLAARSAEEVVLQHLSAVSTRDPVAMASDYTLDAVLARPDAQHTGWSEIADYFETVPARLKDRELVFGKVEATDHHRAEVAWEITVAEGRVASGRDEFVVTEGRITHQRTLLDSDDF
jgi:limonene-1,2-epoxide hydrolase